MDTPLTWKADGPTVWEQAPGGSWFLVGSFCTRNNPDRNAARAQLAATAPILVEALLVALAALQDTTPYVQNRSEVEAVILAIQAATGEAHVTTPRDYPEAARSLLQGLKERLGPAWQTP